MDALLILSAFKAEKPSPEKMEAGLSPFFINSGDHESDCVKDCGPYKFSPCAVGADVMNIVYIHVEKSPFLLKTHWFQYSIRDGNLKVKIDNIICKWQVYIVVNGIVKCKLKK